ncbi:hypothetical protein [Sandaracinobacteroides saxicola]|uniref:Uncharacterized protein n=1 Tax=Sandaracinobacteroides saxicola TaxID=2759707 RepID=A0A7G5IER2_9SPHN|nr:hypothetical protein [Sandaracinobacteroides saxicola]QMW21854.1 hypothetical protein H3309_10655 [Sandaracinobacteroides saxicola]
MKWYLPIRRWVDSRWNEPGNGWKAAFAIAMIPMVLVSASGLGSMSFTLSVVWAIIWMMFMAWRGLRMLRAGAIVHEQEYDRRGKFKLTHEYHRTGSATAARRAARRG